MSALPDANSVNSSVKARATMLLRSSEHTQREPQRSWRRDLADAVRDPLVLLQRLGLTEADAGPLLPSRDTTFPVLVPESYLTRMQFGNPHDPLLRQVLPLQAEHEHAEGFSADAVGDLPARRTAGLLQKYPGRVLLLASGSCAVHCRYCFRRDYPYSEEPRLPSEWDEAMLTIRNDETIREVILSGGDPLMLSDQRLALLCQRIDDISHVDRIRIHTRLPVVLPSRITAELIRLFQSLRVQSVVVVHANHAQELQSDCSDALIRLVQNGLPVLNQAVLLHGINDTVADQCALSEALINKGVMPYYLHQLDRVQGTAHFEVPPDVGQTIVRKMRERLPGYAVPQYVQEIEGELSKTPLLSATNPRW